MLQVNLILDTIVSKYNEILKTNLVGIYLHGSLAMNCFNPDRSDIDFLVVIEEKLEFSTMRELIDVLLQLSENGPKKGFEMSVILRNDVGLFSYPTPFVLHYSDSHKDRYMNDSNYICGGFEDPDLAAHIVITIERGLCLCGKPINEVFKPILPKYYIESIINDISTSREDIYGNPVYFILNLCRVLCYLKDGVICSKKEGGEWGRTSLPLQYKHIIELALLDYDNRNTFEGNKDKLSDFANYMLGEIKNVYESSLR